MYASRIPLPKRKVHGESVPIPCIRHAIDRPRDPAYNGGRNNPRKDVACMRDWKPKQVRKVFWGIYGAGVLVALVGTALSSIWVLVIAGVIFVAGAVFDRILYCCPHCGMYLGRNTGDFCPYCGENVNE